MTHGRKPRMPQLPALADQGRAQDDSPAVRPVRSRARVAVQVVDGQLPAARDGAEGSYGEARSVDGKQATVIERLKTVSTLNVVEHWRTRAKRVKAQRTLTTLWLRRLKKPTTERIAIHLVRVGPGRLDGDNLQGAMKAVRDGVADWLGIDDGDDRLSWTYAQERSGGPGLYAVRIEVTPC